MLDMVRLIAECLALGCSGSWGLEEQLCIAGAGIEQNRVQLVFWFERDKVAVPMALAATYI